MYIRRCRRTRNKKEHIYWELVESYRTARGPRQRVVAYLGDMREAERIGIERAVTEKEGWQSRLFDEPDEPEWVEIDTRRLRLERERDFGGYWLGVQMLDKLGYISFLKQNKGRGGEEIE